MKQKLKSILLNAPGSRIKQKVVLFESDDWGAIRCPDKQNYQTFKNFFGSYFKSPYLRYDTLASNEDLNNLFDVLTNHKDYLGNPAQITFNTIVSNPDFDKIQEAEFRSYYRESFTDTLLRFSSHDKSFEIWKKAISEGLMYPQFHGREHVNVPRWMAGLKNGDKNLQKAFDCRTWSVPHELMNSSVRLQASLDYQDERPTEYINEYIEEGLKDFENIFGFASKTFIPPNFVMDDEARNIAQEFGIKAFQGMKYRVFPKAVKKDVGVSRIRRNFVLKTPPLELIRNCVFEPSLNGNPENEMLKCLKQVSEAFNWGKPAIITVHRLNFIGTIDKINREHNLKIFNKLLGEITSRWPDVKFINSSDILDLI